MLAWIAGAGKAVVHVQQEAAVGIGFTGPLGGSIRSALSGAWSNSGWPRWLRSPFTTVTWPRIAHRGYMQLPRMVFGYTVQQSMPAVDAEDGRWLGGIVEVGAHDVGLDELVLLVCYNQSHDESKDLQVIGRGVDLVLVGVAGVDDAGVELEQWTQVVVGSVVSLTVKVRGVERSRGWPPCSWAPRCSRCGGGFRPAQPRSPASTSASPGCGWRGCSARAA